MDSSSELPLEAKEAAFAAAFQNAPVAMLLLDRDRRVCESNRAAEGALARSDREMKGLAFGNAVRCVHSLEDPEGCGFGPFCMACPVRRIVSDAFEKGRVHHRQEARLTSGSGPERVEKYFLVSTSLADPPQNRMVIVCIEDVTRRKQAEEEARRHREELFHISRVSSVGELAASLSHELSQPLTAILSSTWAAQRFLDGETPDLEGVRKALRQIAEDGRRAGEVMHWLRSIMKKRELERKPLDIDKIVQEVVSLMRGEAVSKDVSLELNMDAALPPVMGNRIQLQQAVLNLLINGFEAVKDREADSRGIVIRTCIDASGAVRVAVQDSGTGIAATDMDRIFNAFFTTKTDGMGMGLSICRAIIAAHDGRLWATNNPGRGATFHFTLPVWKENPE